MKQNMIVGAAALLMAAGAATAQSAFWSGDTTTSDPTFHRPGSFAGLSAAGSAVAFDVQAFFVNVSGEYVFEADYRNSAGSLFNGFAFVYSGAFDSNNSLANLIAGDDDYAGAFSVLPGATPNGLFGSRIALGEASNFGGAGTGLNLTAGVQYFAVITGFGNTNFGTFTVGIGGGQGPVNLGLVPAPSAMALLGLGGLVATRRRR